MLCQKTYTCNIGMEMHLSGIIDVQICLTFGQIESFIHSAKELNGCTNCKLAAKIRI